MTPKETIFRLVHIGATLRNYERMTKFQELATKLIRTLRAENEEMKEELDNLNLSHELYHKYKAACRQLGQCQIKIVEYKQKISLLEKQLDVVYARNREIVKENDKLTEML